MWRQKLAIFAGTCDLGKTFPGRYVRLYALPSSARIAPEQAVPPLKHLPTVEAGSWPSREDDCNVAVEYFEPDTRTLVEAAVLNTALRIDFGSNQRTR